jgi:NAD-dependent DNA ligase
MGIPSVGLSTAARLLEAFDGKLSRIIDASLAELEQVEGVGSKIAEEIFKFFILNKSRILVILEKLKKD